ncbi:Hypothetical predicted protein [Olea europaea subsp. europaea]|uniref:Uncharacterized protein n=1 Tax=Olea europaea subsp. europaea TaxID=158383 RepID=A0A8S0RZX6_OLEEU|nr:Hypothetical predicted protein [Olea europaea subsp. europaea]
MATLIEGQEKIYIRPIQIVEEEEEEEEERLLEGMDVLDSDTVAMQAQKGAWGNLNESNEEEEGAILYMNNENEGGVFRIWTDNLEEGELIYDCFDDRQIALCPCYRFGRNVKRAGYCSSYLQGFFYSIILVIALSNLLAFTITRRSCFLYLAIAFTVSVGMYVGFYRSQIKKKFNIKESRTLEMNNVEDSIWHGRGDTICVGSYSKGNKALFEFSPPFAMSTKSPECHTMQKTSSKHFSTSVVVDSSPLVPASD